MVWTSDGDTEAWITLYGKGEGHVAINGSTSKGVAAHYVRFDSNLTSCRDDPNQPPTPNDYGFKSTFTASGESGTTAPAAVALPGPSGSQLTLPVPSNGTGSGTHPGLEWEWPEETWGCECIDLADMRAFGSLTTDVSANGWYFSGAYVQAEQRFDVYAVLELDCCVEDGQQP